MYVIYDSIVFREMRMPRLLSLSVNWWNDLQGFLSFSGSIKKMQVAIYIPNDDRNLMGTVK